MTVPLRRPTCDTALIAGAAISGLRRIYKPGYRLAKAGVMLLDLQDSSVEQSELDLDDPGPDQGKPTDALEASNTRYGRGSIQLASAGVGGADRTWTMKQELKTPNYTTCWKDLPRARA